VLLKASLEDFMRIIQNDIANNFGYSDDDVIRSLRECLQKLQNEGRILPSEPNQGELPVQELGPSLRRSMKDIRMDIEELYSRSSRTNCKSN
jgi:hypothetical protein